MIRSRGALVISFIALSSLGVAARVEGALGPRHGGVVTLPSPCALSAFDPTHVDGTFSGTITHSVFDGLYETAPDGHVVPVLADGPPEIRGTNVRVRLRPGVLHHGGNELRARQVVQSLQRAAESPDAAWLLGAFAVREGQLAVREVDEHTIELELVRRGVRADIILAASPLAIVVGGDVDQRPLGTGPFRVRRHEGGLRLTNFRHAPEGSPWLNAIQFRAPLPRDEEIRAYELGQLDGSWWGESLYGGRPARPSVQLRGTAVTPHLLLRNRSGVLRNDALFGGVASIIDRQRLQRAGLIARESLGAGLPPPRVVRGTLPRGLPLRMIVREDQPVEERVAGALAAMLDEHGARLSVDALSRERYDAAVLRGMWDLRIVVVRPPLPGRGPLVGAAIAAVGDLEGARALVPHFMDAEATAEGAASLDAIVLGHERMTLYHRGDLRGLAFDGSGRLSLADASRARDAVMPGATLPGDAPSAAVPGASVP